MLEIATTRIGRNALFAGLISHMAALLVAMSSSSGAEHFFRMVFPFSSVLLVVGAFAELKGGGLAPFRNWRFYPIAAVTVIPFLGPFLVLGGLYRMQESRRGKSISLTGLLSALFRLKANLLIILLLMVLLLLLFVFTNGRDDPYYKKRHRNRNMPQSVLTVSQHEHDARIAGCLTGRIKGDVA
ncbi:MAG: hypothetical protein K4571_02260 [Deltaproteobacteria bacterium]